jgi:hypothetical protein
MDALTQGDDFAPTRQIAPQKLGMEGKGREGEEVDGEERIDEN